MAERPHWLLLPYYPSLAGKNSPPYPGICSPASFRISSSARSLLLATAHRSKLAGRALEATILKPLACSVPTSTFWHCCPRSGEDPRRFGLLVRIEQHGLGDFYTQREYPTQLRRVRSNKTNMQSFPMQV